MEPAAEMLTSVLLSMEAVRRVAKTQREATTVAVTVDTSWEPTIMSVKMLTSAPLVTCVQLEQSVSIPGDHITVCQEPLLL